MHAFPNSWNSFDERLKSNLCNTLYLWFGGKYCAIRSTYGLVVSIHTTVAILLNHLTYFRSEAIPKWLE